MIAFFTSLYFYSLNKLIELNKKRSEQLRAQADSSEQRAAELIDSAKYDREQAASCEKQVKLLSKLL